MIAAGDLLNHGTALVLHVTKEHVLCFDMDKKEYVSWEVDARGNTFSGHYYSNIFVALNDYKTRIFK
jgi:hypothetical protein